MLNSALPGVNTALQYPASFGGDALFYSSALFGLMVTAALSFAVLASIVHELQSYGWRIHEPIGIARAIMGLTMLTIFISTAPDVLFLLSWGEVSPATTGVFLAIDRIGDTLAPVPLVAGISLLARGAPSIQFQLTRRPIPVDLWPTWPMVRRQLLIVGLVLIISIGVTLGK